MAFLTYRQSDYKNSEPTQQKTDLVVDRPLTMFEIDQNFYSVNSELVNLTVNYGLGSDSSTENTAVGTLFGSNSANSISSTGFYKTDGITNTPLSEDRKSVLLHVQGDGNTLNDVNALQIVAGIGNGSDDNHESKLYYRNKLGNGDWDSWSRVATSGEVLNYVDEIKQELELKVNISGNEKGFSEFNSKVILNYPTYSIINGYTRGETPSGNLFYNGFYFYDENDDLTHEHQVGGIEYNVSSSFSGLTLYSNNPVITTSNTEEASLKIGWIYKDNDYVTYTYCPSPVDGLGNNQIATVGYVLDACYSMILENWDEFLKGGEIEGDLIVRGDVEAQTIHCTTELVSDGLITGDSLVARLPFIVGNIPSTIDGEPDNSSAIYFASNGATEKNNGADENNSIGKIEADVNPDTNVSTVSIYSIPNTLSLGELDNARISLSVDSTGSTVSTYAPTPPINDNGNQIATTEWVRKKVDDLFNAQSVDISFLQNQIDLRPTQANVTSQINKAVKDSSDSVLASVGATLQSYATKTDLANESVNLTNTFNTTLEGYLPLAGGTMTGQIVYTKDSNFVNGRDNALIKNTESTKYHPLISSKSGSYTWEVGTEGSVIGGGFRIGSVSDANYNSGTNTQSGYIIISTDGNLQVSKDITATGWCYAQTFKSTSDARLKENREEVSYDLSSIKPYRYKLMTDNTVHVGLLAQEVEKVIPEAVSESEEGWKTLDYNSVVSALVGEVNSLKEQIKELKEQIKNGK